MRKTERGFTLVELAIVLVIIGIILGAILKGQEVIKNAQIKRLLNDMRGLEASVWTFYDRYGRMPADCNTNGIIDATTSNNLTGLDNSPSIGFCEDTGFSSTDRDAPWAELKRAGILPNTDNRKLSLSPFGGRFYIGYAYANAGQYRNAISVANIPCFAAKAIDSAIDGALDAGDGRIRELTGANSARNSSDAWTNCTTEDTTVNIVYFFEKSP